MKTKSSGLSWLIFFTMILFYVSSNAQTMVKPLAVMSATKMQVLYKGLDNPVDIAVAGVPEKDIKVSTTVGTITEIQKGKYMVNITSATEQAKYAKIIVTYPWGNKICSDTQVFSIRNVPFPMVFAGKESVTSSDEISVNELKNLDSVYVDMVNFPYTGIGFKVSKFTFLVQPIGAPPYTEKAQGNLITKTMKEALKNIKPDSKIIIYEIYAIGTGIGEKKVQDIVLKVY